MSLPTIRAALVAVVLLFTAGARAQRGVDANIHRPALDAYGLVTVERSQIADPWRFGFLANVDYAANPLRLGMTLHAASGKPVVVPVLTQQTTLRLAMHVGLTSWLQAAVELPMSAQSYSSSFGAYGAWSDPQIVRSGFYANAPAGTVAPPTATALDARVALKARLAARRGFGLALLAVVTIPFGDETAFLGDSGFTFAPTLIADYSSGRFDLALNVGAIVRGEEVVRAPADEPAPRTLIDVGDELSGGLGARVELMRWVALIADAHVLVPLVHAAADPLAPGRDITGEVLGAVELRPTNSLRVKLGAGGNVFASALRHADFRVFLGISWARPATALGGDRDGDGIADAADRCPDQPEDRDGFEDDDGCPDPDNDGDGIADAADRCPLEAEDRDGFQDDDGCPETDNDNDGVPDAQDRCPNEPEDIDGFADDDGCPDLDNDGDGIADAADRCPNEPETVNGIDDSDGCPDSGGYAWVPLDEILHFGAGSAALNDESVAAVDHIAARLAAHPEVRRVRIEGHADDFGAAHRRNQALSQVRAETVRNQLISRGVDSGRLQAVGYGDTRPMARDPHTHARGLNRRVEFITVEQ